MMFSMNLHTLFSMALCHRKQGMQIHTVEAEITIPNTITICQTISIQCYKTQSKGHFKISERIAIEERGS